MRGVQTGRESDWIGCRLGRLHTFEIAAALGLEFFPPAPDGVEDEAHAHAAFDFEL